MNCGFCKLIITLHTEPFDTFQKFNGVYYHADCIDKVKANQTLVETPCDSCELNQEIQIKKPQSKTNSKTKGNFWGRADKNCEVCNRPKSRHTTLQVKRCMTQ